MVRRIDRYVRRGGTKALCFGVGHAVGLGSIMEIWRHSHSAIAPANDNAANSDSNIDITRAFTVRLGKNFDIKGMDKADKKSDEQSTETMWEMRRATLLRSFTKEYFKLKA